MRVVRKITCAVFFTLIMLPCLVAVIAVGAGIVQFALGVRPAPTHSDRCEAIAKQAHHLNPSISEHRFYADCSDTVRTTHQ